MKTLNKIARLALILAAMTSLTYSQAKPPSQPTAQLSEEVKAKLLSDLKSIIIAKNAVQVRVDTFNAEYNKALAGLPKGSTIAVNPDVDSVEVTAPKAEEKPVETPATPVPVKK